MIMNNNLENTFNNESIDEIEKIVISHILNKSKYIEDIFLNLNDDDFNNYNNKTIFKVAYNFKLEAKEIDLLSLINYFELSHDHKFSNFKSYLVSIDSKYLFQQNIMQYIELIKNASMKRKMNAFAKEISKTDINILSYKEKVWELEKKFLDITNDTKSKSIESISEIVEEYSKNFEKNLNKFSDELTGITSGYYSIDKITNGFQEGDLIILAARPGIGKTALAINFLVNASKKINENKNNDLNNNDLEEVVLMFSMEMGKLQVCHRIICQESGVELGTSRKHNLSSLEKNMVSNTITNLATLPIFIDDSSDLSIMDIQSKIKQISSNKKIRLVIIDYLQLLKGPKIVANTNRQQEVAIISRTLKSLARQYETPIIAIAQLSRKIEERKAEGRRPMLSDLRESGAIEQDADLVCFINYKEDFNNKETFEKADLNNVMVEFIIAKNRNGSIGSVDMLFAKQISKYFDATNVIKKGNE